MAAVGGEAPTLFLRKATGLVKGWSRFDAFVYSFLSVNLITLGLWGALSFTGFIAGGSLITSILITGIFVTFLVVTYAMLISVMPRAGGDYVWQSRVFPGGLAFVLAITGWWFTLWQWAPIYGNILSVQLFQPLFSVLDIKIGFIDAAWFASNSGIFAVCLFTIVVAGILVSLGMEAYAKIQRWCFWGGMVGVVAMFGIMLFSSRSGFQSAFNTEAAKLFGAHGDAYAKTIADAHAFGGVFEKFGFTPILGPTLLLIPFMVFFLLWPNWGATLYGEVRGASDYKRVFTGMFWGLWGTVIMALLFLVLVAKTFGWDFYMSINYNWANFAFAVPKAPTPVTQSIWPYPALLATFMTHNRLIMVLMILVMSLWFFGWAGTLFLSSTRVIFAAAFDRILPEWAANVTETRHVPIGAMLLMLIPSIFFSLMYSYVLSFRTLILDATLVIAITFLGTAVAATILPWRKRSLYENSAIAKYKVGGIPMITVSGAITAAFIVFLLDKWWTNAAYGVNNRKSLVFVLGLYTLALVIYVIARVVRKRQGVDISAIYAEIPVE